MVVSIHKSITTRECMPNLPYYAMIWRRLRRRPCCPGWCAAQTVYRCMLHVCFVDVVVAPLLRLLVPAAYPSVAAAAAALHCALKGTRYDSLLASADTA